MIDEIFRSLNQLLSMDSSEDDEKQRLIAQNPDTAIQALNGQLTTRDVLVIATIGKNSPYPQKDLHTAVHTSQPTASRAVERLITLGLIERTRLPNNKKEWQLVLTVSGQHLAQTKAAYDQDLKAQAGIVASHYSTQELTRFNDFLTEIIELKTKTQ
ncbi:MarR family winged helix-turn-helix transcriptional regulator [Lactiplantibacillus carotarum]|uniref:MarR family winged helix-turn-helix transcriptional regulator n=1 Tax=Lactiplantibacillus carotarum TaxID=2993456 RepID=UPI00298F2A00|nr:MarR family transcriptional regulator [Lactiplantibacillus carotarum]